MPEKRTSFFACLVAGLCLALVWLGGIVFIFSYFRDPVFGDWRGGEPSGLVLAATAGVIAASVWLLLFAYQDVAYSHQLWWQFELDANARAACVRRWATAWCSWPSA